jgi:serine/threonine protein phosphatase PrpC
MSAAGSPADSEYNPNRELQGTKGVCQQLAYGVSMRQGSRPYMEDVTVAQAVPGHDSFSVCIISALLLSLCTFFLLPLTCHDQLFCVFDGHGGKKAADFARDRLPQVLAEKLTADGSNPGECLVRAFEQTDEQFISGSDVRPLRACAAAAPIYHEIDVFQLN